MEKGIETLGKALPRQQARVRELIIQYRDPILQGAGTLAAMMMENSLKKADQAIISGDVVAMLQAYHDLESYNA